MCYKNIKNKTRSFIKGTGDFDSSIKEIEKLYKTKKGKAGKE